MTIIGIDPHPGHHTAAALDGQGRVVGVREFDNGESGLGELSEWLEEFEEVRIGVEGPTQPFFVAWATRLMAEGYVIVPVPPQRTSRERRQRAGKSDDRDAQHIAAVVLREPELPTLALPEWLRPLQELVRTRLALARDLKAYRMRLKSTESEVVCESLSTVVAELSAQVTRLEKELTCKIQALAPRLLEVPGVGPVIAGILLAETGDPRRFRDSHAFASYCGAAPVLWQSGSQSRVRVNPRGNRRLNWALHMAARTRKRIDPQTRAFLERKEAEGKGRRGALRALKTYLAREFYQYLSAIWSAPLPTTV